MVIASGTIVDGRVELDGELPEGASVTVIAREGDETFEADPETERMLLDSIAQCERRHSPTDAASRRATWPRVNDPLPVDLSAFAAGQVRGSPNLRSHRRSRH